MTPRPRSSSARLPRSLALFGGTFDPIHSGHVAVARAALHRYPLDAIHFIPAGCPPHKHSHELAPYPHRFAMVALACACRGRFIPSPLEAGAGFSGRETYYSIDVVRHYRSKMRPGDRLWFIVGADAFLDLPNWREPEALLDSCDFIVASRPGIDLAKLRRAIPPHLLGATAPGKRGVARKAVALRNSTVHLLDSVASNISSTEIRRRVARGRSIRGLVPTAVEDYICKSALYR